MTAKIISGRDVAEHILEKELSKKVEVLKSKGVIPNLVVILVGEMKASASYVAQKEKFAAKPPAISPCAPVRGHLFSSCTENSLIRSSSEKWASTPSG